jgi:hypothetical protein
MWKRLHIPLLLALMLLAGPLAEQRQAFGQAGSTGGSIGKTDKSVSGGQGPAAQTPGLPKQRGAGNKSQEPEKWELPQTILLEEHSETRGHFSSTLRYVGDNVYQAKWSHGFSSLMTVRVSGSSITIQREDTGGPLGSIGFVTGTYSGKRNGNTLGGTYFVSNGTKGTWDASW